MNPIVIAVSYSSKHTFSKTNVQSIKLIAGYGVEGDAHAGKTVKHRYLANIDSTKPNIRQVHLIQAELFDEVKVKGYNVKPGDLGENITTCDVDLLNLPTGTQLEIGADAVVELTALRSPCNQIDHFQQGLLKEVLYKDNTGKLVRKTGVMGIIIKGGTVYPADTVKVILPKEPHRKLEYVW